MSKKLQKMLDDLADLEAKKTLYELEKNKLIDQAIPKEVKEQIEDIELEYDEMLERADENIEKAKKIIKGMIVEHGKSVKGKFISAVYNKGRISWDNDKLEGYSQHVPEIKAFRKEGKPYVSLKKR